MDKKYGHPHEDALEKFGVAEIELFRTDLQGDITLTSNGNEITWSQDPCNDYTPGSDSNATISDITNETTVAAFDVTTETTIATSEVGTTYALNTNSKKIHYMNCSSAKKISSDNYDEWIGNSVNDFLSSHSDYSTCGVCKPN